MGDWPLLWAQKGTRAEHMRGWGSTLAGGAKAGGSRPPAAMAAVASLAALPGGASALHGVEDLVVDNGAIGAVQGHRHGLRPRRRAAGALVLHILSVDVVHGFAVAFTL